MIQIDCDNEIDLNDIFNDLGDDEDFYNEWISKEFVILTNSLFLYITYYNFSML
jgi:hypothetical protein